MKFQFSPDQHAAITGICNILLNSNKDSHALCVLTGSAGTGKSTVVSEILKQIDKHSSVTNTILCATTHRAAAVLQDIVGLPVFTGYSIFKLQPSVTKYGKEIIKSSGICKIPHGSILIIDEASMISNAFLKAIVPIIKTHTLKLLFIGDPFQLPPPKDICSIFDGSLSTFILTTIHRQAENNPILKKANEFREFIEGIRTVEPVIQTSINTQGEGIYVLSHTDFVSKFVQKYLNYTPGTEVDVPLCTYTNESAINYNSMIRKATYFLGTTIEPFYPGERLISNTSVMQGNLTLLSNNEIVYVKEFYEGEIANIPGYYVKVKGEYSNFSKSNIKTVFCPKIKSITDKILNRIKAVAIKNKSRIDWINFYALKNSLADLRPPFAGTTHKIQGGTFSSIFIDKTNINKCHDETTRAQLLYVALTRASKNVYINS